MIPDNNSLVELKKKKVCSLSLDMVVHFQPSTLPASPQQIVVEPFAGNLPPAAFHLLHLLLVFGSHLQVSLPPPEGREKRNRETNDDSFLLFPTTCISFKKTVICCKAGPVSGWP